MRQLLAAVFGVALLLSGTVVGVAGTALLVTNPCQPTYRLALQPADTEADPPETTVAVDDLTEVQRAAVEAAIDERTNVGFGDRRALEALTDDVIAADGDRYVARLVDVECDTPYSEVAFIGFTFGLVGFFLTSYVILRRRLS